MMDLNFTAQKPPKTTALMDIEQMSEAPQCGYHHRHFNSDTSFCFTNFNELLLFHPPDIDLSSALPSPSPSPSPSPTPSGARTAVDSFNSKSPENASATKARARNKNFPSSILTVRACRRIPTSSRAWRWSKMKVTVQYLVGEKKMGHHRHSNSTDGSLTFKADSTRVIDCSKAMAPDKLAELALMEPKKS